MSWFVSIIGKPIHGNCAVGLKTFQSTLALVLLVACSLALTGCQALGQVLGVQPRADAPAYSGVGVLVVGSENDARVASRADQSGAVGAQGSAQQSADQSLEIPAEVVEALVAAAQQLIAAGNPSAAAAVLGTIHSGATKKRTPPAPAAPAQPGN